jgi:hypothetical protein
MARDSPFMKGLINSFDLFQMKVVSEEVFMLQKSLELARAQYGG